MANRIRHGGIPIDEEHREAINLIIQETEEGEEKNSPMMQRLELKDTPGGGYPVILHCTSVLERKYAVLTASELEGCIFVYDHFYACHGACNRPSTQVKIGVIGGRWKLLDAYRAKGNGKQANYTILRMSNALLLAIVEQNSYLEIKQ